MNRTDFESFLADMGWDLDAAGDCLDDILKRAKGKPTNGRMADQSYGNATKRVGEEDRPASPTESP